MTIEQAKISLRAKAKARRGGIPVETRVAASLSLAHQFAAHVQLHPGDILAGYWPTALEIDDRPILGAASRQDIACALPVATDPHSPLTFFDWQPGGPLTAGAFGIMVPEDQSLPVTPTIILVPLLAFDPQGYRLGYGGGYYDRTIAHLRHQHGARPVRAIGVAFAALEVDNVPHELHDQRLDAVMTEAGFHWVL